MARRKVPAGVPYGFDSTSSFHSYAMIPTKICNPRRLSHIVEKD